MAITAQTTPESGFRYTPQIEKECKDAFSVNVVPLDAKTLLKLEDKVVMRNDANEVTLGSGAFYFEVCVRSIKSWENFNTADGAPIEFVTDSEGFIKEDILAKLPADIITEIANIITSVSRDPSNIQVLFDTN